MAKELLGWGEVDLTKCDIFSLGISAYEVAMKTPLPLNGAFFHELRAGKFSTESLPSEMSEIFRALMAEDPDVRPSAERCLKSFLVLQSPVEKELYYQKQMIETLMHNANAGDDGDVVEAHNVGEETKRPNTSH